MKKHIPNFLTSLNLFSGILAVQAISQDNWKWAAVFVLISLIFDFCDGLAARILNARSEIGKQLDSLADMVSFGLVPGYIMYMLLKSSSGFPTLFIEDINILPYLGFLITIFSALRLAKFNIDINQENSFIGLPTPANTILILSTALIINNTFGESDTFADQLYSFGILLGLTLLSCYLLIGNIPLMALKFKSLKFTDNKGQYILIIVSIILLILFKLTAIPFIIMGYILISLIFRKLI